MAIMMSRLSHISNVPERYDARSPGAIQSLSMNSVPQNISLINI